MLIQLKWLDNNPVKDYKTEIYRSDNPFDNINDATLLTVVEPGISTYADTDVIYGNTYYYKFRLVRRAVVSPVSDTFVFTAVPYTGPGNSISLFGDESFGYYGKFPMEIPGVPKFNEIREIFGLSPSPQTYTVTTPLHKFSIGGDIRGIYPYPLAIGSEIPRDNPILVKLMAGQAYTFNLGLHEWSLILPSANHKHDESHQIRHWPGELRSMIGVVTEMYARVEDADTGNRIGGRLTDNTGLVEFYAPLTERFPDSNPKYMVTSDWIDDTCTVINWTAKNAVYPNRPKELHIEDVVYDTQEKWDDTLVWPILVYSGLVKSGDNQ